MVGQMVGMAHPHTPAHTHILFSKEPFILNFFEKFPKRKSTCAFIRNTRVLFLPPRRTLCQGSTYKRRELAPCDFSTCGQYSGFHEASYFILSYSSVSRFGGGFLKEMSLSGVSFVIYQLFRRYWFFVYFLNKAFQKIILQKEASDEQVKVDSLEVLTIFLVCQTRQVVLPGSIGECALPRKSCRWLARL